MDNGNSNTLLKFVIGIFIFFVTTNILFLNWWVFTNMKDLKKTASASSPTPTQTTTPQTTQVECTQVCKDIIKEATASIAKTTPAPTNKTVATKTNPPAVTVKEFYIPFGSGSVASTEWKDVPGIQATINPNDYGKIKSIYFEATFYIPTQNGIASVRLWNTNDQRPVWYSELSTESSTPKLIYSPQLTLDAGAKTYSVQMKSSLGYETILSQARLKINTE